MAVLCSLEYEDISDILRIYYESLIIHFIITNFYNTGRKYELVKQTSKIGHLFDPWRICSTSILVLEGILLKNIIRSNILITVDDALRLVEQINVIYLTITKISTSHSSKCAFQLVLPWQDYVAKTNKLFCDSVNTEMPIGWHNLLWILTW